MIKGKLIIGGLHKAWCTLCRCHIPLDCRTVPLSLLQLEQFLQNGTLLFINSQPFFFDSQSIFFNSESLLFNAHNLRLFCDWSAALSYGRCAAWSSDGCHCQGSQGFLLAGRPGCAYLFVDAQMIAIALMMIALQVVVPLSSLAWPSAQRNIASFGIVYGIG